MIKNFFDISKWNKEGERSEFLKETAEERSDKKISCAFGKSLKELREYKGVTQIELAELLDIPFQTLSTYERGRNNPSMTQALKIARYFHLTIEDFVDCGLEEYSENTDIIARYKKILEEKTETKKQ